MLSGVILSLIDGSLPALKTFGLSFLHTQSWNPVTETFGAAAPIYGTIVTSLIAMLIGFPISIGIAVFITELCRSEEHTSELQSLMRISYAVFCLKKKKLIYTNPT